MRNYLIAFLFLFPAFLRSQDIEAGAFFGFANYQGDLVQPSLEIGETSISIGALVRYLGIPKLKVRGSLYYGLVAGSDANASGQQQARSWSFESKLIELGVQGEFHPFGRYRHGTGGIFKASVSPYLASGIGVVFINSDVTVPIQDQGKFPEPGEKNTSLSIPLIVGLRLDAYEFYSLGLEWGWRATFSDYIDGVSEEGNPDKKDWYLFIGLSAAYIF